MDTKVEEKSSWADEVEAEHLKKQLRN